MTKNERKGKSKNKQVPKPKRFKKGEEERKRKKKDIISKNKTVKRRPKDTKNLMKRLQTGEQ